MHQTSSTGLGNICLNLTLFLLIRLSPLFEIFFKGATRRTRALRRARGGAPRARLRRVARGGDSIPVPTCVSLRGESGRRGRMSTKLRRWLLRGRLENHLTGRCGMRAGNSLVDRSYTHGDWLQLRRYLSSSTHVRQRGVRRVADELCARSSQDTC